MCGTGQPASVPPTVELDAVPGGGLDRMKGNAKVGITVLALLVAAFATLGVRQGRIVEPAPSRAFPFDGEQAFEDLKVLVRFGPRPAGSRALEEARGYIVEQLVDAGFEPELDEFTAKTPLGARAMVNIRVTRTGARSEIIALGGHYDTKLMDADFVGANDGGSSAALLLEMARNVESLRLEHTLEIIFFDGEEAVIEWTDSDSRYGSRHDVDRRYHGGTLRQLRTLLLVDMVADKDLNVLQETSSTAWLKSIVWDTARALGYGRHFTDTQMSVSDDHIPYLNAGIPAIDIIDIDYPHWHTPADTLDKTSSSSLKVVGDVVYQSLIAIDRTLR